MRLTGQLAIASGIVGILATAVLLAFYLFLASIAIGIIATVIGVPIWSIWLGRHFLRQGA